MAKKRTELEARLLEEHQRVLEVVERWQTEQRLVDEVRVSLADAEVRLEEAVLAADELGDRAMVARLLDLPAAQVRKSIASARRGAKRRSAPVVASGPDEGSRVDGIAGSPAVGSERSMSAGSGAAGPSRGVREG
jgi:hypothetical protein